MQPALLLLDEPFTGLDAPVRRRLCRELRGLQRELGLSTVIVTHDPEEAALLADEVIVLDKGRALQAGPREVVFHAPRSPQVAALLGIENTHHGRVVARGRLESAGNEIHANTGTLPAGTPVVWCVRPEHVSTGNGRGYRATLADCVDLGSVRELTLLLGPHLELVSRTSASPELSAGEGVTVSIAPEAITVWRLDGQHSAQQPSAAGPLSV